MHRRTVLAGVLTLSALGLVSCTDDSSEVSGSSRGHHVANGEGSTAYPLDRDNCEAELRFDAAPARIVLLETAPVTILEGLGVLDRVVAKAGVFPSSYYDAARYGDLLDRIDAIPLLSDDIDGSGHLQINQEAVIALSPDLVIGLPDGVTREGMRSAGAETLVQISHCSESGEAGWEDLEDQLRLYGDILDRPEAAERLLDGLTSRVDAVKEKARGRSRGTAAVLYPTIGGGPLYAYGAASMATPQLDAVGLDNVFASSPDRVFEVNAEALIDADPDHLVILHQSEGPASDVLAAFEADSTIGTLRAVTSRSVRTQHFDLTEPVTPLLVDGVEQLDAWLAEGAS